MRKAKAARARKAVKASSAAAPGKGKLVYFFGDGKADGRGNMKDLLGGKGAGLAEMTSMGLPVPPGFTITTAVCSSYYANGRRYPKELKKQVDGALRRVETLMDRGFGSVEKPLLFSVRSGARDSMPGMMDTVLNLGLTDRTVEGLAAYTGSPRFAWDSYRRFVQMYGDVVMGMKPQSDKEVDPFEAIIDDLKHKRGVELDVQLTVGDLQELVERFKRLVVDRTGNHFPTDPEEQLWGAISAVFNSWENERAKIYRKLNNISSAGGTAVNVQAMVFGNLGDDCATGVAFTRDPSTGERRFFGEYLVNAQGEDVVAGIRTPEPINIAGKENDTQRSLEEVMPSAYRELVRIYEKLEKHYRDMQDIEFTIEHGRLFMLQTRNGKRTAQAAIRMAVDMVKEKLITPQEAILRVKPEQLDQLLHRRFDPNAPKKVVAKGLNASPGAAVGKVVFSAADAQKLKDLGEPVILVRVETSPEDIGGMTASEGILTQRGGRTSHAAVVARGMGKCCVAGCGEIAIDYDKAQFTTRRGGQTAVVKEADWISLDGSTGEVMLGRLETFEPELSGEFHAFMKFVDRERRLKVRTNADTPADSELARRFGAEGIGLCRTEHMFFQPDRILAVREMILAGDRQARENALAKLLPMQRSDFKGIFRAMAPHPVTIRFLDPPLHEFLPAKEEEIQDLARELGQPPAAVRAKVESLHEFNPMLGFRGSRLAVVYPEIFNMQARAVIEAASDLLLDEGLKVTPEIMLPIISDAAEFAQLKKNVIDTAHEVNREKGTKVPFLVGTMIELPRAAILADEIAAEAEFFSFGTNDLTQTTMGLSRDDAGRFLPAYIEANLYKSDPFVTIDRAGVGKLMEIAGNLGRKVRPGIKLGICGEHGGDPDSVKFCHKLGLDYVSCSPYRVPIARLAAAQAAVEEKRPPKKK
ncbi:MAG: pyruvate, phosphate dikinase [Deltaproteobacteria bacterium]|nr:pyruvate, phosphate dikinase [Deltaproteobacteria bacterium]